MFCHYDRGGKGKSSPGVTGGMASAFFLPETRIHRYGPKTFPVSIPASGAASAAEDARGWRRRGSAPVPCRSGRHGNAFEDEDTLREALIPIHRWPQPGHVGGFVCQPIRQPAREQRREIIARVHLLEAGLLNILDRPAVAKLRSVPRQIVRHPERADYKDARMSIDSKGWSSSVTCGNGLRAVSGFTSRRVTIAFLGKRGR